MKTKNIVVFLLALGSLCFFSGNVLSADAPKQELFSNYYHFGSLKIELQPGNVSYLPGEQITFKGKITNDNTYPMLNGQLYVRIVQENKTNFFQNGDFIVDEFFAIENINLKAQETKEVSFQWQVPQTAMKGNYKLASFFVVDKKYNMSGLSFSSNIFGGFCSFQIKGNNSFAIYFDRNNVKFNNDTYLFRAFIPQITNKDKANIVVPVKNTYSVKKDIQITYDLYWWDGLKQENKLKTTTETITVPANSQKNISYTFDNPTRTVYYLSITAQSGTDKSIIPIRFAVSGITEARINFIGANKFPLAQNEKTKAFVTFHSTSFTNFEGKIDLFIKDLKGKILAQTSFPGPITGNVQVLTLDTPANLHSFTVQSNLYDKNNNIVDTASVTYQEEQTAASAQSSSNRILQICIAVLIVILLAAIIFISIKMKQRKNVIPLLIVLALAGGTYMLDAPLAIGGGGGPEHHIKTTEPYTYSPGKGATNFQQTIGPYYFSATGGCSTGYCGYPSTASLTINYDLFLKQGNRILTDEDTVSPGDKIYFVFNKDGGYNETEWWTVGGQLDSPPAYWVNKPLVDLQLPEQQITWFGNTTTLPREANPETLKTFQSLPDGGCEPQNLVSDVDWTGYKYAPLVIQTPTTSLMGGSNLNCSNNSCVVGNGQETSTSITATVNKTYFQQVMAGKSGTSCEYAAFNNAVFLPIEPVTKTWNLKIVPLVPPTPPIPVITDSSLIEPDWCLAPFQYILNWKVNTTQQAKQIQVSTSPSFSSIFYDSEKTAKDVFPYTLASLISKQLAALPIPGQIIYDSGKITSDVAAYTLPAAGSGLGYNRTYYWRVRVWNTDDVASVGWSDVKTFTTPKHAYPDPSFTKSPTNPKIGETIQFTDTSTAHSSSIQSWSWVFQEGTPPTSTLQNPSVVFNSAGKKDISLTVTDTDGYVCSISGASGNVGGTKKSYIWTEIAPN